MLINKIFKKPLPQSDLEYYFKYLSEYNLYRGIKNIKVANLLHFREEEIIYMRGIYTADMEEKGYLNLNILDQTLPWLKHSLYC